MHVITDGDVKSLVSYGFVDLRCRLIEDHAFLESLRQSLATNNSHIYKLKEAIPNSINDTHSLSDQQFVMSAKPNPFSLETQISYTLPDKIGSAKLVVYDLNGKELMSLPLVDKGNSSIMLSASQLNAGMYTCSKFGDAKLLGSKRLIVAEK